jgi:hypothetical protein
MGTIHNFGGDKHHTFSQSATDINLKPEAEKLSLDFSVAQMACKSLIDCLDDKKEPLPYVACIMHILACASRGVTMDTFKPLIKGGDYVGVERRTARRAGALH